MSGNRCGHNPKKPVLTARKPIRKGKGGLPRILSLVIERASSWYWHPMICKILFFTKKRQMRSERREAIQVVLETILQHLDLASMCLGTPTLSNGFVDVSMKTLVEVAGIGQRRIERAIADLTKAGFLKSSQPRTQNKEGSYFGCRAIRVVKETLFEWLNLGQMLAIERRKASERLAQKAKKANRKLSDLMKRLTQGFKSGKPPRPASPQQLARTQQWNEIWLELVNKGVEFYEAKKRTNEVLGYPPGYSPGQDS